MFNENSTKFILGFIVILIISFFIIALVSPDTV